MPQVIKSNLINDETIELLHKFQIFKGLSIEEIKIILGRTISDYQKRIAKLVRYERGEVIISEGDFGSWIFWVVKGAFEVIKNDISIAVFDYPGEVFGEMSILEGDSRSASVVAIEKGVCLNIDMSILDNMENVTIREKISRGIQLLKTERLNITTNKLVAEKRRLVEQQKLIQAEWEKLREKEARLLAWETALIQKDEKIQNITRLSSNNVPGKIK